MPIIPPSTAKSCIILSMVFGGSHIAVDHPLRATPIIARRPGYDQPSLVVTDSHHGRLPVMSHRLSPALGAICLHYVTVFWTTESLMNMKMFYDTSGSLFRYLLMVNSSKVSKVKLYIALVKPALEGDGCILRCLLAFVRDEYWLKLAGRERSREKQESREIMEGRKE